MAGDWIKMRTDLRTHPKVKRIASALSADKLRAIGALHAVWSYFDEHSIDGILHGFTAEELDEEIGQQGITRAMESVEWIEVGEDVLSLPRFDEHNGQSAKRRASDARRKKTGRGKRPHGVRKTSAERPQSVRTDADQRREEKRRVEKKEEMVPSSPSLPADGAEATDIVHSALAVIAPSLHPDDIAVSFWLRDVDPDPWWLVAALCDMASGEEGAKRCAESRTHRYFTPGLVRRKEERWDAGGDPKGYAQFALKSIQKLRGAA